MVAERRCLRSDPASRRSSSTFSNIVRVWAVISVSLVVSLQTCPQR